MIATPLFAVVPLILAVGPVAAVPQRFWNAYCAEAVTLTETVSLPASTLASDDPQATTPRPETVIQTVTLYTSLTVAPTAEGDSLSSAEAEDLPRPTKIGGGTAETVTVFSTVTNVSTVTVHTPQPTETSGSAVAGSPDSTSAVSPESYPGGSPDSNSAATPDPSSETSPQSNSEASQHSNSAVSADSNSEASQHSNSEVSPDPTSDPEDSPKSTATAIPPALIVHPHYANSTQAAPYDNSSQPTNNTSSPVVDPPILAPYDNSSQPTNDTSSSVAAAPVAAPYDNSTQLMNTTDTSPPVVAITAAAVTYDNSSQVSNTTDTASLVTPAPSVSAPVDDSSQDTTTSDTTANPSAFGSAFSSLEAASNTTDAAALSQTTYTTYDSSYTPTDTWTGSEGLQTLAQLAGDASAPATPTPSSSESYDNSSQPASDTSLPAAPTPSAFGYGAYENGVYFTNWGIYAADYQPQSLPSSLITRVIYAFADFGPDGTVVSSDTFADLQNQYPTDPPSEAGNNAYGCVKQLYLLKKQNRSLKVLLSVGGWTYSAQFPVVAADQAARQVFAASAVQLVTDWGFDGIEIDWEYPGSAEDAANFVLLLSAVRSELDVWAARHAPGYRFLLTVASPAGPATYGLLDLEAMDAHVDSWNLMAYDYAGSWDSTTGHQANLYPDTNNNTLATKFNTDQAVDDYIARGISPSKIVLGMPTFGRSFEATTGLGKPFTGVGPGSPRLQQPGLWLYKELPRAGATELYDDVAKASYSYNNVTQELISYDNVYSAKVKKSYMTSKGLGGVIFWEASGDTNGPDSLVATLADNLSGVQYQQNWLNYSTSQYDNIRNGVPGP